MAFAEQDKRAQQRRVLRVPIICYPHENRYDPQAWIFGETVDVGMDGLRIRFRGTCLLQPDAELDLLILEPDRQGIEETDVPACIRAQVSWLEKEKQLFGVKYLE
ncbi:MAG: PilZ domain-containing protein [Proteobacteria bacterium]|nr:PilZ domain-containing protein [Pseudomonadota bacterium]MBU1232434.1 PilZ domain-containing protein [Pseudomonadota bacterium]MBU1417221.1 PilZ domain-containing protein [Pseudomonadota bacterium]MBU1453605.1 PilZ domain-containing protein [Pseudomonadota bacterium]